MNRTTKVQFHAGSPTALLFLRKPRCQTPNPPTPQSARARRMKRHPVRVSPPPAHPSHCPSMLRGVNSRGVGVGGSTMVHGYRMCLSGYAAWAPSVHMSHGALLSHSFSTLSISRSLSPSLQISLCPSLIPPSLNPLTSLPVLSFGLISAPTGPCTAAARGHQFINGRRRGAGASRTRGTLTWRARPGRPHRGESANTCQGFLALFCLV